MYHAWYSSLPFRAISFWVGSRSESESTDNVSMPSSMGSSGGSSASSSGGWVSSPVCSDCSGSAGVSVSSVPSVGSVVTSSETTCSTAGSAAASSSAMAVTGSIVASISTAISRLEIRFFIRCSSCVFLTSTWRTTHYAIFRQYKCTTVDRGGQG